MLELDDGSLNGELRSVESCDPPQPEGYISTYTTLTTLQPLSPVCFDKSDASAGGSGSSGYFSDLLDSSYPCNKYDELALTGYEFLEPLMPIAVLDSAGNTLECETSRSTGCSLFSRSAFLSPSGHSALVSFDGAFSSFSGAFNAARMLDEGFDSSRGSSPYGGEGSGGFAPNPALAGALKTVLTAEAFETFMDGETVGTHDIAEQVSNELKRYNIPQALFAQHVLKRSQGTLSDLLRNPKPWSKLKSGRDTFARMWTWLQEPETQRLAPFRLCGFKPEIPVLRIENTPTHVNVNAVKSPEGTMVDKPHRSKPRSLSRCSSSVDKKPRMVFTDPQRAALLAIFDENPRPSREQQASAAAQLDLPVPTVANFFMNARRRSKWREERGGGGGAHGITAVSVADDTGSNDCSE